MNAKQLFTLKGINYWYLASAVALNLFWTLGFGLLVTNLFLQQMQANSETFQLILLAASFIGPFLIAWLIGRMAGDGRGPTYGIYGSFGRAVVLGVVALPSGLVGLMLIVAAIAGGLNGGMLSLRNR